MVPVRTLAGCACTRRMPGWQDLHYFAARSCLSFCLKLFLILQQSSTIRTAKIVQAIEMTPAMVNASTMKPILTSVDWSIFIMVP